MGLRRKMFRLAPIATAVTLLACGPWAHSAAAQGTGGAATPPAADNSLREAAIADARIAANPSEPDHKVHQAYVRLGEYDSQSRRAAAGVVIEATTSNDDRTRTLAYSALTALEAEAEPAVRKLLDVLRHPGASEFDRRSAGAARFDAAVEPLGAIGPATREALPHLAELSREHANPNVRRVASAAAERINR